MQGHDAGDLKRELAGRAEDVARLLLPGGKKIGRQWCAGSVHGDAGDSLKVELAGQKAGLWADFAAGGDDKGDMLDLWARSKRITLGEAIRQARAYLGWENPSFTEPAKRVYKRPKPPPNMRPAKRGTEVEAYLRCERGLYSETIEAFRIGQADAREREVEDENGQKVLKRWKGPWILFPYFMPPDEADRKQLANIKWLHTERRPDKSGKPQKVTIQEAEAEPILFGWHTIPPDAREVTITEGEIDAMSVWQWGIPALSVPMGAGTGAKQKWVEVEFDRLARFDTIYLLFDNDEEGQKAIADLVPRLGRHRVRVVTLPGVKDANEGLLKGWTAQDVIEVWARARDFKPQELTRPSQFRDAVVSRFYPGSEEEQGWKLPWYKADKFRLRLGELTVATGINGHGKSILLSQLVLSCVDQGATACVASMEMPPPDTLARAVRQMARAETPQVPSIDASLEWLQDRLWIFNVVGSTNEKQLMEAFIYARRRFGCRLFIVDSLMRCGLRGDDYDGQDNFVKALVAFAEGELAHVVLVAHARKGQDEKSPPGKLDVKGSGGLTDNAYNSFTVWRNKDKEIQLGQLADGQHPKTKGKGAMEASMVMNDLVHAPDAMLIIDKQRNGTGWEGRVNLWFESGSALYREHQSGVAPRLKGFRGEGGRGAADDPDMAVI